MATIYLYVQGTEHIGILAEKEEVQEIQIVRPDSSSKVGNIYVAKVVNVETSLQAAFIEYGGGKLGFLPKKEVPEARQQPDRPLRSILTEGQRIIVQVTKDAYQQKGAKLTANITVPGTHIVYLPFGEYIAVSRKLADEHRNVLREKGKKWIENREGAIFRTSSQVTDITTLEAEWKQLRRKWEELYKASQTSSVPSPLYTENPLSKWIRKFQTNQLDAIYIDEVQAANRLKLELPSFASIIKWEKQFPISISLNPLYNRLSNPRVFTPHGVEIWIEQTEALTVIDVNSSTFTKGYSKEDTSFRTNQEAAREIAKQLRLRNISGIIMIDFLKMKAADQAKLLQMFQLELRKDGIRTELYGFTKLGLLEMTRKRESDSIPSILGGDIHSPRTFSMETYAYMMERELLVAKEEALVVDVHPTVLHVFKEKIMERIRGKISSAIYFRKNTQASGYDIIRSGSSQTINEFLASIPSDAIDKVF
ncbi:ribonuclease E/G [Radiobacillus deserti]|uniref:S1 RNA-binding domain-containing protein n=1 Tax=Radiobacillus deserti TaxID=2594883 RepID=A0A516KH59_9BACI|nr:ribonuclease E/G [Radiobacillus deserti]QDP40740.1 S1 RNA-binding domain-containing protein [Radiobacillus deserti]